MAFFVGYGTGTFATNYLLFLENVANTVRYLYVLPVTGTNSQLNHIMHENSSKINNLKWCILL